MRGTVKWFSPDKGYGFIVAEDGRDIYVHYTDIEGKGYRDLEEGQEVQFQVGKGRKGPKAVHVKVLQTRENASAQ